MKENNDATMITGVMADSLQCTGVLDDEVIRNTGGLRRNIKKNEETKKKV